jgi:hypothetical protein
VSGQLHVPAALFPGKEPTRTRWIGGWADYVEKGKFLTLPGLELRSLGRPAVASRHIDCAIPAPIFSQTNVKNIEAKQFNKQRVAQANEMTEEG